MPTSLSTTTSMAAASPTATSFIPEGELPKTGSGLGMYLFLGGMLALTLMGLRVTRRWVRSHR
ncbi:MAG: LPXTG cell wall anchor domain-containing protein [Chloroflexi bacterium]|nr:LPXTG cell wall anchor domain-containing protein [Chloroflexota bacterium]